MTDQYRSALAALAHVPVWVASERQALVDSAVRSDKKLSLVRSTTLGDRHSISAEAESVLAEARKLLEECGLEGQIPQRVRGDSAGSGDPRRELAFAKLLLDELRDSVTQWRDHQDASLRHRLSEQEEHERLEVERKRVAEAKTRQEEARRREADRLRAAVEAQLRLRKRAIAALLIVAVVLAVGAVAASFPLLLVIAVPLAVVGGVRAAEIRKTNYPKGD